MIIGGGGWSETARNAIVSFAEANALPVGVSFRCQDYFPNHHPNYAGHVGLGINPTLAEGIRQSDLLLVLGARLGDCTTSSYTLIDCPVPAQTLIHIHADPEELGRVYDPALAIAARHETRSTGACLYRHGPQRMHDRLGRGTSSAFQSFFAIPEQKSPATSSLPK